MKSGTIVVHLVFPETLSREITLACLTDEDQARADRFRFHDDALHWTACRAGLRMILGEALQCAPREVPLTTSKFGKPGLAPPFDRLHFNLSHCADLALIVLSPDGPVGIDVEERSRGETLQECESTFCHPLEIDDLPTNPLARSAQLLRIWTAKEAVLKALGTGLSHPPETVRIHFGESVGFARSDIPLAGMNEQRIHTLDHPLLVRHRAAISTTRASGNIEIIAR